VTGSSRPTAGGATIADVDARYPFGRVARPDDAAGVVAFLATTVAFLAITVASYIGVQRIQVDVGGPDHGIVATGRELGRVG